MALRATMSKPTVAKTTKASGLRVAVQRVATTAGVSVATLALALAASADVSGRKEGARPIARCGGAPQVALRATRGGRTLIWTFRPHHAPRRPRRPPEGP